MTANMEVLENKMETKLEGVRAEMLDRFSSVDQKLASIEELLKKIVDSQNISGNSPNKTGGIESSRIKIKGNTVGIRKAFGMPYEDTWCQQEWFDLGDQSRQGLSGMSREAGSPNGWVGLYTDHLGKDGPQETGFGRGKDINGPAWMGSSELDVRQKDRPLFAGFHEGTVRGQFADTFVETVRVGKKTENDTEKGCNSLGKKAVETGQIETFKDSSNSDRSGRKESWVGSSGRVADITDVRGEEENQTRSWASCGIFNNGKTDTILQDSLEPDQRAKKDCGSWSKAIENEINEKCGSMESDKGHESSNIVEEKTDSENGCGASCGKKGNDKPEPQVANDRLNEKGHEEESSGSKRKHLDSPVEGRNDGPISKGPCTATRQSLDAFTPDEQEILDEIEPIIQSIQRIMYRDGYNYGDPLSADDQAFILDNVFNHHPNKDQKSGAGVDYIMVSRYMHFSGSRCFYVVSTDGRKEDFSYHKCLKNFVKGKYPDKADKFNHKYFKNLDTRPRIRDHGSSPVEARTSRWSVWNRDTRVTADEARTRGPTWQMRAGHMFSAGTKKKRVRRRHNAYNPSPR